MSVQLALAFGADIKEELPNETDESTPVAAGDGQTPVDKKTKSKKKKMNAKQLSRRVSCLHYIISDLPFSGPMHLFLYVGVSHNLHCRLRSS